MQYLFVNLICGACCVFMFMGQIVEAQRAARTSTVRRPIQENTGSSNRQQNLRPTSQRPLNLPLNRNYEPRSQQNRQGSFRQGQGISPRVSPVNQFGVRVNRRSLMTPEGQARRPVETPENQQIKLEKTDQLIQRLREFEKDEFADSFVRDTMENVDRLSLKQVNDRLEVFKDFQWLHQSLKYSRKEAMRMALLRNGLERFCS